MIIWQAVYIRWYRFRLQKTNISWFLISQDQVMPLAGLQKGDVGALLILWSTETTSILMSVITRGETCCYWPPSSLKLHRVIGKIMKFMYIDLQRDWKQVYKKTRRFGPLHGPTSRSCGGLWPLTEAYYAVLAHFWHYLVSICNLDNF